MGAAIRCPECDMVNHPDDLGFPRCGQCHEDLQRCNSCRHFTGSACSHPQSAARFTLDLEAAKHCVTFRSRFEARSPRMLWNIPAPVWVSILLLLIMSSLSMAAWFIDPIGRYFRGNPLRLETAAPAVGEVGHPYIVTMRVTNLLPQTSSRVYVEIGEEFLAIAEPGEAFPDPVRQSRFHDKLLLEFSPLAGQQKEIIQIPFMPKRSGTAIFSAKVYAPSNQLRHEVRIPVMLLDRAIAFDRKGGVLP